MYPGGNVDNVFLLQNNEIAPWARKPLCYKENSDGNSAGAHNHYSDVIMDEMASKITSLTIVYSTVY